MNTPIRVNHCVLKDIEETITKFNVVSVVE